MTTWGDLVNLSQVVYMYYNCEYTDVYYLNNQ